MTSWLQRELLLRYPRHQISWDELWLSNAYLLSVRSRCSRDRVGAVLVTDNNRVVSAAYNGAPSTYVGDSGGPCATWCPRAVNTTPGEPGHPDYRDCHASHAELNCIKRASGVERSVATKMYVSRMPCYQCAKEIGSARATHNLREVIVPSAYEVNAQHGNHGLSVDFLTRCDVKVRFI